MLIQTKSISFYDKFGNHTKIIKKKIHFFKTSVSIVVSMTLFLNISRSQHFYLVSQN